MAKQKKRHKVFVYGTLRNNKENTTHTLYGYKMFVYPGRFDFPYLVHTRDLNDTVHGELLDVSDADLAKLDSYEGVDRGLYTRDTCLAISDADAAGTTAFLYMEVSLRHKEVPSGNWFKR